MANPKGQVIATYINDRGKQIHRELINAQFNHGSIDLGEIAFHRLCASAKEAGAVRVVFDIALN